MLNFKNWVLKNNLKFFCLNTLIFFSTIGFFSYFLNKGEKNLSNLFLIILSLIYGIFNLIYLFNSYINVEKFENEIFDKLKALEDEDKIKYNGDISDYLIKLIENKNSKIHNSQNLNQNLKNVLEDYKLKLFEINNNLVAYLNKNKENNESVNNIKKYLDNYYSLIEKLKLNIKIFYNIKNIKIDSNYLTLNLVNEWNKIKNEVISDINNINLIILTFLLENEGVDRNLLIKDLNYNLVKFEHNISIINEWLVKLEKEKENYYKYYQKVLKNLLDELDNIKSSIFSIRGKFEEIISDLEKNYSNISNEINKIDNNLTITSDVLNKTKKIVDNKTKKIKLKV